MIKEILEAFHHNPELYAALWAFIFSIGLSSLVGLIYSFVTKKKNKTLLIMLVIDIILSAIICMCLWRVFDGDKDSYLFIAGMSLGGSIWTPIVHWIGLKYLKFKAPWLFGKQEDENK